ncbi:MAG: hypothetical protein KDK70_07100 [Myxococcales bacterium]|nr:hypothetical protein [Myxococcales bacterium]
MSSGNPTPRPQTTPAERPRPTSPNDALESPGDRVWRWWVLWVLGTNAGFMPGMFAIGLPLADALEPSLVARLDPQTAGVLVALIPALPAGLLTGVGQWLSLRTKLPSARAWWWLTGVGWTLGTAVAVVVLFSIDPTTDTRIFLGLPQLVISVVGGAGAGALQQLVLRGRVPGAGWWIPVSALGWGIQFPGMLAGLWLVRGFKRAARPEGGLEPRIAQEPPVRNPTIP